MIGARSRCAYPKWRWVSATLVSQCCLPGNKTPLEGRRHGLPFFYSRLHWKCGSQMSVLTFSAIVFAVSALAGFLGSLTGLGGGVVVTPVLTLLLGVDLHYAMGASLVSVIATSSGAAAAYVKEGFSNVRLGMFLEIATTLGAVAGAHLTAVVPT